MLELDLLFAIPNGGKRGKGTAGKLRAKASRLVCRIYSCPLPGEAFSPIHRNESRERQDNSIARSLLLDIDEQGYMTAVCYSANDAILILENHLGVSSR